MSGVCAKHDRYVRPGEVCPYCPPAALPFAPIHVPVAITPMGQVNAGIRASIEMHKRMVCEHKNSSVSRDACEDCGMSGMEMLQLASARYVPIE